jgi:hypothetical protein
VAIAALIGFSGCTLSSVSGPQQAVKPNLRGDGGRQMNDLARKNSIDKTARIGVGVSSPSASSCPGFSVALVSDRWKLASWQC